MANLPSPFRKLMSSFNQIIFNFSSQVVPVKQHSPFFDRTFILCRKRFICLAYKEGKILFKNNESSAESIHSATDSVVQKIYSLPTFLMLLPGPLLPSFSTKTSFKCKSWSKFNFWLEIEAIEFHKSNEKLILTIPSNKFENNP